jgi:3-isopropylmalate/(R)-2-methylmalate dehydratase small subunit
VEPFVRHKGKFVTFDRAHIDTDAIIPARFLKKIERIGFGELLFHDLRHKEGRTDEHFPLHHPKAQGASVLVTRHNFGCGSSREHAVWALSQAGFRAVVAPRVGTTPAFADIFRNNSYKNGLLPIEVSEAFAERLFQSGHGEVTIDLENKHITAHLPDEDVTEHFHVPEGTHEMLLKGLDEISLTLQHEAAIAAYEAGAGRSAAPDERPGLSRPG